METVAGKGKVAKGCRKGCGKGKVARGCDRMGDHYGMGKMHFGWPHHGTDVAWTA